MYSFIFPQCQRTVKMRVMPYCTLLLNFLEGEISGHSNICNPISLRKTKHILHFFVVQYVVSYVHIFPALLVLKKCFNMFENSQSDIWYLLRISTLRFALCVLQIWRLPSCVLHRLLGSSISRGLLRQSQRCEYILNSRMYLSVNV